MDLFAGGAAAHRLGGTRGSRSLVRQCLLAVAVVAFAAGCSADAAPQAAGESAEQLAVSVASFDLAVGEDRRFLVGVMTRDRQIIGGGHVDMAFRYVPEGGGSVEGPRAEGAFLAVPGTGTPEDLEVPVVLGEPASHDHGPGKTEPHEHGDPTATGVYQAMVDLDRAGFWEVAVTAVVDGDQREGTSVFQVHEHQQVTGVGDPAPRTHSPTVDSEVPAAAIDSRAGSVSDVPDPTLHQIDLVDALDARRPVVVAFTTPTWCTSRFCGPITDTVESLGKRYGDRAAFIHVEIWADIGERVLNDAVEPWIGTDDGGNEPWVFLVGADGTVTARWDNVLDESELVAHLEALPAS